MIYLIASVLCSVTVGVLLKLAKRYQIDLLQSITWNYLFALLLSLFFFRTDFTGFSLAKLHPVFIALGILLPVIFLLLGKSVRHAGLARTDIAQRLSLFISLCGAYFLFGEQFDRYKEAGLFFGFLAIFLTMYRKTATSNKHAWLYLLMVFFGFGAIDILFKMVATSAVLPYTASLSVIFLLAFIISLGYILLLVYQKKTKLQIINFICGCILGTFNFGNILYYLKAHQAMASNPSTVFAAMNLGVIIGGTMVGVFIFKEKLNAYNYIGLGLGIIAIVLIALSKIYAV